MEQPIATSERSLFRKIAEVTQKVGPVAKNARHEAEGYLYADAAAITMACRGLMAERNLVLVGSVTSVEWRKISGKASMPVCVLSVQFTVHDGDSGEQHSFNIIAEAQDPADKSTAKAQALAHRYALERLFQITTSNAAPSSSPLPEHWKPETPVTNPERASIFRSLEAAVRDGARSCDWTKLNAVSAALKKHLDAGDITASQHKVLLGRLAAEKQKLPPPAGALATQADSAS